jgi:hypothetical protein
MTTIENQYHSRKNPTPYNLGPKRNFEQVFGRNALLWFIPVYSSLGNGVDYPLRTLDGTIDFI